MQSPFLDYNERRDMTSLLLERQDAVFEVEIDLKCQLGASLIPPSSIATDFRHSSLCSISGQRSLRGLI